VNDSQNISLLLLLFDFSLVFKPDYITSNRASIAIPVMTPAKIKYCCRVSFSFKNIRDNSTEKTLYEAIRGATIMAFFAIAKT